MTRGAQKSKSAKRVNPLRGAGKTECMRMYSYSRRRMGELMADPEWLALFLGRIAGGEFPKAILESGGRDLMLAGPAMGVFLSDETLRARYDEARRIATETMAYDCIAIADEQKEVVRPDGTTFDPEVGRDKLRVETRLKLIAKWNAPGYGDKAAAAGSGNVSVVIRRYSPDEDRDTVAIESDGQKLLEAPL